MKLVPRYLVPLTITLSSAASAQVEVADVLEAVRAGREVEVARLDSGIAEWTSQELLSLIEGAREAARSDDAPVRTAASDLLQDVHGFPRREVPGQAPAAQALTVARAAMEIVAELGDARDLVDGVKHSGSYFELAESKRPPRDLTMRMVAAAMAGDPKAVPGFRSAYRAAPASAVMAMIEGLVGRKEPGDAAVAVGLLGERPDFDPNVLKWLLVLVRRPGEVLHYMDLARIRSYLNHEDPNCRAGAARLAGRTDDFEATATLIKMLGDRENDVASAAHRALKAITQLRFSRSPYRWHLWYEREASWWDEKGAAIVQALPTLRKDYRVSALNELTSHPLERRRITPAVVPFLEHSDTNTVMMALSVLESTRSVESAPRIEKLMAHSVPEVQELAGKVVFSLTGRRPRATVGRTAHVR